MPCIHALQQGCNAGHPQCMCPSYTAGKEPMSSHHMSPLSAGAESQPWPPSSMGEPQAAVSRLLKSPHGAKAGCFCRIAVLATYNSHGSKQRRAQLQPMDRQLKSCRSRLELAAGSRCWRPTTPTGPSSGEWTRRRRLRCGRSVWPACPGAWAAPRTCSAKWAAPRAGELGCVCVRVCCGGVAKRGPLDQALFVLAVQCDPGWCLGWLCSARWAASFVSGLVWSPDPGSCHVAEHQPQALGP